MNKPATPSKSRPHVPSSASSTSTAVMLWLSLWILVSIGYVFTTSIILRKLPLETLMIDMYALSIAQTSMNTFISAMFYFFNGKQCSKRVPTSANKLISSKSTGNQVSICSAKDGVVNSNENQGTVIQSSRKNVHVRDQHRKERHLNPAVEIVIDNNVDVIGTKAKNDNGNVAVLDVEKKDSHQDDRTGWLCTYCSGLENWKKRTIYSDLLIIGVGFGRIGVHIASLLLLRYAEVSFAEVTIKLPSFSACFDIMLSFIYLSLCRL